MKRIPLAIASVALILSLGTVNALAAGHHGYQSYAGSNANGARNGLGRNFVDENGDGVCDNRSSCCSGYGMQYRWRQNR